MSNMNFLEAFFSTIGAIREQAFEARLAEAQRLAANLGYTVTIKQ